MKENVTKIIEYFIEKGEEALNDPTGKILPINRELTEEENNACRLVEDLKNYPHFFLFFCLVNRRIPAKKAVLIPYQLSKIIGKKEFKFYTELSFDRLLQIFNENFRTSNNYAFAKAILLGIQRNHSEYSDDASNIWNDTPSSKTVVKRFREFWGVGQKISTMAANILVRQFGIKFRDLKDIDISVDVHIKRIFKRTGILTIYNSPDEPEKIIEVARKIYPEYPGILDFEAWRIGTEICSERQPKCSICPIDKFCPKFFTNQTENSEEMSHNNITQKIVKKDVPEEIINLLENENRLTYKVKILYNLNFSKQEAWNILREVHPRFNQRTFNNSWSALKKSQGSTPISNNT